ncbi:MFS transporter [Pseudomonas sp. X10]
MRTQLAALGQPAIWSMMLMTILGFGASFAAFTFLTPILTDITGFSSATASSLLVVFGVATLIGNLAGGRLADRLGWQRALRLLFVLLAATLVLLGLSLSSPVAMVVLLFVWGVLAFGMTPGFQAGMLDTAERYTPRAVDFASGLNISAFNLGITLGETAGSRLAGTGQGAGWRSARNQARCKAKRHCRLQVSRYASPVGAGLPARRRRWRH